MDDESRRFGILQMTAGAAAGSERREALASLREIAEGDGPRADDAAEVLEELAGTANLPAQWQRLDLDASPEPPRWLVRDVLARGWITLCHGREGSGKSMFAQTIVGAAFTGGQWLGRDVKIGRVLVVDEENPADIVNQRLKALGYVHGEHADRLLYFSQIGAQFGSGDWGNELLQIVKEFKPDLVVIDSMLSATTATWDNATIVPLFVEIFKPLTRLGCAVLLIHHDRKAAGEIRDRASGGAQWLAQVDRQIAFEQHGNMEIAELEDGSTRMRFPVKLEGGKSRQGRPFPETYLSICSDSEPHDSDLISRMWLEVEDKPPEAQKGSWRPTWYMRKLSEAFENEPGLSYNEACKKIGKAKGDAARAAVDALIGDGYVRVEQDGQTQRHFSVRPFSDD